MVYEIIEWLEDHGIKDYDWTGDVDETINSLARDKAKRKGDFNRIRNFFDNSSEGPDLIDGIRNNQFEEQVDELLEDDFIDRIDDLTKARDDFEVLDAPSYVIKEIEREIEFTRGEQLKESRRLEGEYNDEADQVAKQAIKQMNPNIFTDWMFDLFDKSEDELYPINKAAHRRVKKDFEAKEREVLRAVEEKEERERQRRQR
jgi:hypothetical protein